MFVTFTLRAGKKKVCVKISRIEKVIDESAYTHIVLKDCTTVDVIESFAEVISNLETKT